MSRLVRKSPPEQLAVLLGPVDRMLGDNRMHVGSYRQSTRGDLYSLLLLVVRGKQGGLTRQEAEKVIGALEDEKDPRNMPAVLQIYDHLLSHGGPQV